MRPPQRSVPHAPLPARARTIAAARREQLRRRTRRIRKGVATVAVTLFLLAFMGIYVQMATGHDPALSANRRSSATGTSISSAAASKAAAASESSSDSSSSTSAEEPSSSSEEATSSDSEESAASSSSETSEPSSVTTSQS